MLGKDDEKTLGLGGMLTERYRQLNVASPPVGQIPPPAVKRVKGVLANKKDTGDYTIKRRPEVPKLRYSDLGGIDDILEEVRDVVELPFRHRRLYHHLGVEPPRGVLLHGAPGCGKTSLALAIAGELNVPLIKVAAPELVAGMSGESEGRIRELFNQAKIAAPCLLFIDEIDTIGGKRDTAPKEMERRMVAQLLACMDELDDYSIYSTNTAKSDTNNNNNNEEDTQIIPVQIEKDDLKEHKKTTKAIDNERIVMVIGATNRPDSLDPALRRAGRFDREIQMNIPNEMGRKHILQVLTTKLRLAGCVDLSAIARNTPGFVGADLKALCQEAATVAIRRILQGSLGHFGVDKQFEWTFKMLEAVAIEPDDFAHAARKIQPSAKREGFATVPNVKWEEIGALEYVREELRMAIVEPLRHPEKFAAVGLTAPAGVLLWGPPGCGKTLLAKAVASESHSNFISIKGPELLSKYVGESERAVRQVFERARHSAPCIVFFDELDALCPRRRGGNDEGDAASSRVVNQLLTELDGLEERRQVFVLAATNRPDVIDPAMTRPGRLDKMLFVNLPTPYERVEILKVTSRNIPWASDVDLEQIGQDVRCENFSGADLAALVREAGLAAIRDSIILSSPTLITDHHKETSMLVEGEIPLVLINSSHIEVAFSKVRPSVSSAELASYERLRRIRS